MKWVDNHLVHVLAPNIYRSPSEALESFDYITTLGNFTTLERWTAKYAGAAAMYLVSKKLKKKHNITDERAALYAAADTWIRALNDRQFMGGNKPNLADLSVFGVLRPIWKLQSGIDLAKNTGIGAWYKRMETEVGESSEWCNLSYTGAPAPKYGGATASVWVQVRLHTAFDSFKLNRACNPLSYQTPS
ncbi:Prostaglandin E synthase 2 [Nymphaea thermarum]|nr:Prostaglandin E synthase 2 [Nymphaea thermarum]